MAGRILILGSSNIDFILRIPRFPQPGETLQAIGFAKAFGGKGANQAVAARALGGKVTLITQLGFDEDGRSYRKYLLRRGFDPRGILQDSRSSSGMAFIELTPNGENRIIISPGANGTLTPQILPTSSHLWKDLQVFVTQLEIPLETVQYGIEMAKQSGARILLNPAPALPLPQRLLAQVDFLVPNEIEAQVLTGIPWKKKEDLPRIATRLLDQGAGNVIITLGSKGLFFKNRREEIRMGAIPVKAIDTTAAGDAFVGALAVGLAQKKPLREILRLANGTGALACLKLGAQPSLPGKSELMRFLRRSGR